jgi:hypothetical protein
VTIGFAACLLTYIKRICTELGLAFAEYFASAAAMTDTLPSVAGRLPQASLAATPASVMVYVDFDVGCDKRIKIAADWAAKFNATLIGVAAWAPGREAGGWFAAELESAEDRSDRILAEMEKLGKAFGYGSAEPSRQRNGEAAFISRARSFLRRREGPTL